MSIDALESVRTSSQDNKEMSILLQAFLEKHGATMRHLDMDLRTRDAWGVGQFIRICEKAPRLESLSTTIRMQESTTKLGSRWPGTMLLNSSDCLESVSTAAPSKQQSPSPSPSPKHHVRNATPPENISRFARLRSLLPTPLTHRPSLHISAPAQDNPEHPRHMTLQRAAPESRRCEYKSTPDFQQAITSLRHLKRLSLKVKLLNDSYQLVTEVPCPYGTSGAPSLRLDSAKDIVSRLWDDFGSTSPIEKLEVVFFAPHPSEKIWTLWIEKENRNLSPVVRVKEEGDHYNPANFDPFG